MGKLILMQKQISKIIKQAFGDKPLTDDVKNFVTMVNEFYRTEELDNSEFNALITALDDIVFELDDKGVIIQAWAADESKFFIPREKFMGKKVTELFDSPLKEQLETGINEVLNNKMAYSLEYKSPFEEKYFVATLSYLKHSTKKAVRISARISEVTDKKRTEIRTGEIEHALKQSEERYQLIVEGTAAGIWDWMDVSKDEQWWSDRYYELLGYAPGEIEAGYSAFLMRIHPDDKQRVLRGIDKQKKGNESVSLEYRLKLKTGNYRWFFASAKFTKGNDNTVRLAGSIVDIHARKKAEEKLKLSEEKFRNLIEAARDIFFTTDADGNYTYVNEMATYKLGYSAEELLGLHFTKIVRADYVKRVKIFYYRQILRKIPFSYLEFPVISKSGEQFWVGQNAQLLFSNNQYVGVQAVARDITAVKNAIDNLAKNEERFRNLIQNSMDVITVLDEYGRIKYDSFSRYTQFGYEKSLNGTDVFSYFHPDDVERAKAEFKKGLMSNGVSEPIELRFKAADNTWRHIEIIGNNLIHEPSIQGIVINSRDITERKKAEQSLIESEQRFRNLVQYSSDVTTVINPDGTITYESPSFYRLFGYEELLVGRNVFEFIHPDDIEYTRQELKRGLEKGGVSDPIELRFRAPDGSWKYIEAIGNNLLNEPTINGIVINSREITERKKVEFALAEFNSRLSAIIESTSNVIFAIDREYRYIAFNKAHKQIIKALYGENIEVGQIVFINKEIAAHDAELLKYNFDKSLAGEKVNYIHATGDKSFYYEISMNPIRSKTGDIIGVAVFSQDVTEKKKAEEELLRAKNEAVAAAEAKSDFLSNMSHEIRTPMNAIIGITDLLIEKKFDEETSEYLNSVKYSADNLLVIINDILDFSKIESRKILFENIDFNLHERINELHNIFKHKADEKNIILKTVLDIDVPEIVKGDPYRLNQIIFNLVGNAIKFTFKGYIKIHLSKLSSDTEFDILRISVEDTGIGIPKNKQESVFESFTQAYTDTSRRFGGTGLGLAITKNLTVLQGGKIYLVSDTDKGTTFTVEMPFRKATNKFIKRQALDNINEKNLEGLRILLVEDNKMNQFVAKQIIAKWNAEIVIADNGKEAIDFLSREDFDLVLMDLQMPEMSGYQATSQIRSKNTTVKSPAIPIIALTADAFAETKLKVFEAGMNDFVTKPFNQDELYLKIVKHVQS